MTTPYARGRAKEYKLKHLLEDEGLYVIRSAGSHSFADLIAIDDKNAIIRFIQVKSRGKEKKKKRGSLWLVTEELIVMK